MNERATAAYFFKENNAKARDEFRKNRDMDAFIATSVYTSAKLILDEMAVKNPELKPVAIGVAGLQHVIRGAVDNCSHQMRAPDHDSDSHHDYFSEMKGYVLKHAKSDFDQLPDAAKAAARHLGLSW